MHLALCVLQVGVSPQDTAVLLTEPAHNPLGNRETSVEILFEKFAVPALYMGVQGTLAMLGHGTTSGIVVDSGDGLTQVTPVYGGHTLKYASRRMNLAGADLTAYLQTLLTEQGNYFSSTAEMELVREIKESMCYTALNYSVCSPPQSAAPCPGFVQPVPNPSRPAPQPLQASVSNRASSCQSAHNPLQPFSTLHCRVKPRQPFTT